MYHFTNVNLTLEQVARIKSNVSQVISTTMNGANVKRLPAKMGYTLSDLCAAVSWRCRQPLRRAAWPALCAVWRVRG
jgi:hypothetical protein